MFKYIQRKDSNMIICLAFSDSGQIKFYLVRENEDEYNDYCCICENTKSNQEMLKKNPYIHCFDIKNGILLYLHKVKLNLNDDVVNNYIFPKDIYLYIGLFHCPEFGISRLIEMYKTVKFNGDSFDVIKVILKTEDQKPAVICTRMSLWELFRFPLNSYSKSLDSKYKSSYIDQGIFEVNLKDTLKWFEI